MMVLGWIARLVLVITLLPWGAYHCAGRGPLAQAPERSPALAQAMTQAVTKALTQAQGQPSDSIRPVAPPIKAATIASHPRRCKTGVLNGSGCAPDAMIANLAPLAPPMGNGLALKPQAQAFASSLAQAPPRRPPRSV